MSKNPNRPMDTMGSNNNKSDKNFNIYDEVADKVKGAGKSVREFADDAQENLSLIREKAENRLRTNPVSTCAAIFVSGVILGAIIRR